jgi:hypothetical protein
VSGSVGATPGFTPVQGQASPDIAGRQIEQMGAAANQVGQGIVRIAENLQDQYDEAKAKDYLNRFDMLAVTSKQEWSQQLGPEASRDKAAGRILRLEKERARLAGELENPVQRELFQMNSERRMISMNEIIYSHSGEQTMAYNAEQSKALSDAAVREGIQLGLQVRPPDSELAAAASIDPGKLFDAVSWDVASRGYPTLPQGPTRSDAGLPEPEVVKKDDGKKALQFAINNAVEQRKAFAATKGWKPDDPRTNELVLQTTTEVHAGIVEGLVRQGRSSEASAYMDALKKDKRTGEVDPNVLGAMEGQVRQAGVADRGMRLADDTLQALDKAALAAGEDMDAHNNMLSEKAGNELLRQFRGGKVSAEELAFAMNQVNVFQSSRREAFAGGAVQSLKSAETWLSQNPNETPQSPTFPVPLRDQLVRFQQLAAANQFAEQKRYATDWTVFGGLLDDAKDGKLAGMSRNEFTSKYRGQLADREWNIAMGAYQSQNTTNQKVEGTTLWKTSDRIKEHARKMGILTRDPRQGQDDGSSSERFAKFMKETSDLLEAYEQGPLKGQRNATPEEVQRILDEQELDVVWNTSGIDSQMPYAKLTPEEQDSAYVVFNGENIPVASVPKDVGRMISKALLSEGYIPQQAEIVQMWALAGRPRSAAAASKARADALQKWLKDQNTSGNKPDLQTIFPNAK